MTTAMLVCRSERQLVIAFDKKFRDAPGKLGIEFDSPLGRTHNLVEPAASRAPAGRRRLRGGTGISIPIPSASQYVFPADLGHAGSSCRQMPSKNRERFRPGSPSA